MNDPWAIEEVGKLIDATDKRLIAGGFKVSGRWELDTASRARFVGEAPKQPGVYAYAVNGKVHYVGSAQGGIAKRLRHYEITKTKRTAFRIRGLIIEKLREGSKVTVLTIVPRPIRRNGLPVDPIVGLEEGLIRAWQPSWNVRGLGAIRKKMGVSFWVFESWRLNKAVVHRGECPSCQEGRGVHGVTVRRNSHWLGPYATRKQAFEKAQRTGRDDVRGCKRCAP